MKQILEKICGDLGSWASCIIYLPLLIFKPLILALAGGRSPLGDEAHTFTLLKVKGLGWLIVLLDPSMFHSNVY